MEEVVVLKIQLQDKSRNSALQDKSTRQDKSRQTAKEEIQREYSNSAL